jgi:tetratricopeptide (TPR) repeat protein
MKRLRVCLALVVLALAALWLLRAGEDQERLSRHRNLGKAFYENPTTHPQAVEEFRKALKLAPGSVRERLNYGLSLLRAGGVKEGVAELEKVQTQDPSLPHTFFNLGIAYKREGRYPEAIIQFERMIRLVPEEAVAHYNLGQLFNLTGKEPEALEQFRIASRLSPNLVAPHFQIYNIHRLAGRDEEAARALAEFQRLKEQQKQADEQEDMEWCNYAEIYDPIQPADFPEDLTAPLKFQDRKLSGTLDPATAGLLVLDADGDGRPDLLAFSNNGIRLYRTGSELVEGIDWPAGAVSIAAGDFDNDGLPDLCLVTATGAVLYQNVKGRFRKKEAGLPGGAFRKALWLDYDHDYDLDLFLLGPQPVLLRNEGAAGFRAVEFPFTAGEVIDAAPFRLIADGKGFDFVLSYQDRSGVLYRDRLLGNYEAVQLPVLPARATSLQPFDIDNDCWLDLALRGPSGVAFLLNRHGKLEAAATPASGSLLLADLLDRGVGELIAGNILFRNRGLGRLSKGETLAGLPRAAAWAEADFDLDGRTDLAAVAPDGSMHLFRNQSVTQNQWLRVGMTGVKNLRLAAGAEVEVKAGTHYQKKIYPGFPLLFGLGTHQEADTVRITWPNGLIQNEPNQPAGQLAAYKEAPRLSGSCPMVFAWNGREFQFITDVLGVAPLGASAGGGRYFSLDHDESIQISGRVLALLGGRYEIRMTEELREVSYLDQVRLIAVDHPADLEIFTNEKFKAPPFPDFRLFGVRRRIAPLSALDHHGQDVLPKILARDRAYPDDFRRNWAGVAELHWLDLDFGGQAVPANRAVLILSGWVDWADGSTFLGAAQEGKGGLVLPYLQVKDARGSWQTVIEDMGMPAGKPKTIAVDLTGKFLSASRQIRIVTNLCVYWDEVFLSEEAAAPPVRLTTMPAETADLRFRGFSQAVVDPARKQPETFRYAPVQPASLWNPTPGLYTRYGDVCELLETIDDRFVITGSGDELRLRFDPAGLPPLPRNWKRDFLLAVDGWSKDGDANTAFSQTVDPLPFHAMSSYPYPAREHYPRDLGHEAYRLEYNRRPALRLIGPLAAATGR